MPATKTFAYQAVDTAGKRAKGKLDASNEAAAVAMLRQQGVVPVALAESNSVMQRELTIPGLTGRTKLKDLAILARQFATMTASGMSLLRTLTVLEEQAAQPRLKKAITEVRIDVETGTALSVALAKHHKVFPVLMVAMVRAGETGGFLDAAMERVAVNFEKEAALKAKIKGAMTYPVVVLGFTGVLIAAVLIFIVPIFEKMFSQVGGQLPLPTRIIVSTSHAMVWAGPLLIVVTVVAVGLFRHGLRTRPGLRLGFDRFKLRLPVLGKLFAKIAVSRFSRNLGVLLSVGVPVMQALDVVGATIGNAVLAESMKDLQAAVRDGLPMSAPMRKNRAYPQMVTQMIEVGEESGQLSQMLDKIADFYDREVDSSAEGLTSAIEPIMVLLMGGVVGAMVICLYLPMFSIYQNVQGAQ